MPREILKGHLIVFTLIVGLLLSLSLSLFSVADKGIQIRVWVSSLCD